MFLCESHDLDLFISFLFRFLDLLAVKEVYLGGRDAEREKEMASVASRYGLTHEQENECGLTILYGYGLSDNRLLYIVCPPTVCR